MTHVPDENRSSCLGCGGSIRDDESVAFVHGDLLHARCAPPAPALGVRAEMPAETLTTSGDADS